MSELKLQPANEPAAAPSVTGSSTLDRIRALYEDAKGEQTLDLAIPRNPVMGVRYRAVDADDFDSTATRLSDAQIDVLIAACDCVLVRNGKEWEPLTHDGQAVRFDETLGEIVGVPSAREGGTARQVVLKAFSRAPSPRTAIAVHFEKVSDWMAGEGQIDEERLLGES